MTQYVNTPSIFDDKYSVLSQLEEVKKIATSILPLEGSDTIVVDTNEAGTAQEVRLDAEVVSNIERSLKTPTSAPTATQLVGVDTGNAQQMIEIGSGLAFVENVLYASGSSTGSGKYLHIIKFVVNTETYQYGQIMLLLNTSTNFTGTDEENSPTYDQFWDLGMAMTDAGYTAVSVLTHEDGSSGTFTSLSFRYDSSGENVLMIDTSDGESIGFDSFHNFIDTVIPV